MLKGASSSEFASVIAARATMSGGIPAASRSTAVFAVAFRADLAREARGAVADDEDVRGALHHRARDGDRMEVTLECCDRAGAMTGAVHDRRVELDLAEDVRFAASADARIGGVRLDDFGARFDRVERRTAAHQDSHAGGGG